MELDRKLMYCDIDKRFVILVNIDILSISIRSVHFLFIILSRVSIKYVHIIRSNCLKQREIEFGIRYSENLNVLKIYTLLATVIILM